MRAVIAVTASAVALIAVAAPAQATVPFSWHQRGYQAVSYWQLGDRYNTFVSIYGSVRTDQVQGGKPVPTRSVSIDVAQSYCDTAHDRWVDRYWFGNTDGAPVSIARNFATANWLAVPVTLTGEQYNTPLIGHSCDALDWEHVTTVTLPAAQATFGAAFTTSGPMVISNSSRRERYDPWFYVTINVARARMASTVDVRLNVSNPDLTALGSLPTPDFAFVGHNIHTEITVTRGHVPGGR
jgi:hypothetical protein